MELTINNKDELFANGSRWLRADFHLHTMSDTEFAYDGNKSKLDEFAQQYVEQLEHSGIRIGVITNHNKFNLDEFKVLRRKADAADIYLLPGIEFSLKDGAKGVHALIVFSYEWIWNKENQNYIQRFLDAAFKGIPNYQAAPYPNSNFSLTDAVQELKSHYKDFFIVMAHVDDANGMFKELEGRNITAFIESESFTENVYALQKCRKIHSYGSLSLIARVEGTDNANGGISAVGGGNLVADVPQETFVKLGDFNFAALKYALRDCRNRVRTGGEIIPTAKNSFVESIQFVGGKLDGKTIRFSPELNCLIGIRGSGKSSVLEILRYSIGLPLTNSSADSDYKNDLVEFVMGSGGKAIVTVVGSNGKRYRIEKYFRQKENIYYEDGASLNVSVDSIFKAPIYFGQKDLSNKNIDFETDLLHRLMGGKMDEINQQITIKKSKVESIILELRKLRNLKQEQEANAQTIKDKEHQVRLYADKGVADKLEQQTHFERDGIRFSQLKASLDDFVSALTTLRDDYAPLFTKEFDASELNQDLYDLAASAVEVAKEGFSAVDFVIAKAQTGASGLEDVLKRFAEKGKLMQEEFAKIKRELNSDTLSPDMFMRLNRELEVARLKEKEFAKRIQRKKVLLDNLVAELGELNGMWHEEFQTLEKEVARISASQDRLSITIGFKQQKSKYLEKVKSVFRGTGVTTAEYQALVDKFPDFIEMYRNWASVKETLSETHYLEFKNRFGENLADLLTFRVEDKVEIKYSGMSISRLSLGQRASALILFLLAQRDNDVLIIDQPEDDLDNQTIYDEVIKRMQELKGNMQFIFATHNPNIPVLGDSEKMVAFSFDNQAKIEVESGSIDMPKIHEKIISIMEGGEEAFVRRNNIYKLWR